MERTALPLSRTGCSVQAEYAVRPEGSVNGRYNSWIIHNENLIVKETDKSVFEYNESGIPKGIRWFFEAEELSLEDKIDITLFYQGKEYSAYIKKEVLGRTRIFWSANLATKFKTYYNSIKEYPMLMFARKNKNIYKIWFAEESQDLVEKPLDDTYSMEDQQAQAEMMDIDSLMCAAKKRETMTPKEKETVVRQYVRDPYVAEYSKARATGICMLCGKEAPFSDGKGKPYLESHHIVWISKGGTDTINNTVALCPNCHRKMHIVADKKDIDYLRKVANIRNGQDNSIV